MIERRATEGRTVKRQSALTPALAQRAAKTARALGMSPDALVREAVRLFLRAVQPELPTRRARPRTVDRFRAGKRLWSRRDDQLLKARYADEPTAPLARELQRSLTATYAHAHLLGLSKSDAFWASPAAYRLRRGDNVGAAFRFPKGHVPANKGLRRPGYGPGRMKETQFKKGVATNWMPVGSTRLVDGYVYRKISDVRNVPWTRNWKVDHGLVWEAAHGPVPHGHAIAFLNGDRTDIRLENLELITRRELMARNSVHNLPKPLADTIRVLGALNRQIRKRTNAHADEEQNRRSA